MPLSYICGINALNLKKLTPLYGFVATYKHNMV